MIKGKVQTLGPTESKFKKWIGIVPVQVVAVNPNAKRIMEIFPNRKDWGDPQYLQDKEYRGNMHKWATIDLYMQGLVPDDTKPIFELRINIIDVYNYNKDRSKVQVIDKYAQTTWLPTDLVKAHAWKDEWESRIDRSYRPAIVGESTLMLFLQKYLGIPMVQTYDAQTKTWKYREDNAKDECECRLDDIKKVFKGDFSEILNIFKGMEESWIKIMVGIRHTDEGKIIHIVNDRVFANAHSYTNRMFEREIDNQNKYFEASGTTPYVIYSAEDVHEYTPAQSSTPVYATNVAETGQTIQQETSSIPQTESYANDDDDDFPF